MLFLLFQLGKERYALDTRQVAEVLPLLGVKHIPLMPAGVTGILDYRGKPVPVIDLIELTLGRAAARQLSTRIVLVHLMGQEGGRHLLGLIVERATQLARYETTDFSDPGITNADTPYLGLVVSDVDGIIQWVEPDRLLPVSIAEKLFKQLQDPNAMAHEI